MSNNETQNGSTVHPMVLAAAKGLCAEVAKQMEECPNQLWQDESEKLIQAAKAALTDCGALECLEALEGLHDMAVNDSIRASDLAKSAEALSKVYGSKPAASPPNAPEVL